MIGDSIEIRIISSGKKVVLGIIAPRGVSVSACKVSDAAMENTIAASHAAGFGRMIRVASRKGTPVVMSFDSPAPENGAK
jgi:sRNA-binding carbon storage regulator CsrA